MGREPKDPQHLRMLFERNAHSYDRVNPLLSFGQVYLWRRRLVGLLELRAGERVLDAFSGPGDLGRRALPLVAAGGTVVFADLSPRMLAEAARQAPGVAFPTDAHFVMADLLDPGGLPEELHAPFDAVLYGFGLRYTADPALAFRRLGAFLRPGGRLGLLEFTVPPAPKTPIDRLSRFYFRQILPGLARGLTGERELYEYLRDSSGAGESPGGIAHLLLEAGLELQRLETRVGGLVTLAVARKPASDVLKSK